jgi:hypothetical protein
MKALTAQQPWAWAIINGGKDVENRSRPTKHRGQIYIHAAKTWSQDGIDAMRARGQFSAPGEMHATLGMVIGTVDVVDCHHSSECGPQKVIGGYAIRGDSVSPVIPEEMCSPWSMDDNYHWVLANPRALACPFPETGKLGIWNLGRTS